MIMKRRREDEKIDNDRYFLNRFVRSEPEPGASDLTSIAASLREKSGFDVLGLIHNRLASILKRTLAGKYSPDYAERFAEDYGGACYKGTNGIAFLCFRAHKALKSAPEDKTLATLLGKFVSPSENESLNAAYVKAALQYNDASLDSISRNRLTLIEGISGV